MRIPDVSLRVAAALVIACHLGCQQTVDAPTSSVRANAMEDYQAGRFDAAAAGFEQVLKSDPRDYLAHFQLAQLLQDQRKDYLGAIVHFRLYLDLRPPEDKTTLAADRIEECKNMLLSAHAQKNGAAPAREAAASTPADKKQERENASLSAQVAKLREENKNLRFLLSKLGESGKGRASALGSEVKKMLAELRVEDDAEARRRSINPTDAELLDDDGDAPPSIQKPAEEPSGGARPPVIRKPPIVVDSSPEPDPKPVRGNGVRGGGLDGLLGGGRNTPAPARPSTYKVQPGDTLQGIALRFYGSRSKWHDIQKANMTTISTDGRVKVGQTLKLP